MPARKTGAARKQNAAGSDWFTQAMGDANAAIVRAHGGRKRPSRGGSKGRKK